MCAVAVEISVAMLPRQGRHVKIIARAGIQKAPLDSFLH